MDTKTQSPLVAVGLMLAVAVLLLTPLVVYLVLRSQEGPPGLREETAETSQPVAKQQPKFKRAYPEFDTADESVPKAKPRPSAMPAILVRQSPRLPVRPLPSPADIPVGMARTKLIASFGRPNMVTTQVNEGQALETFHYLQPEAGTETVVLLSSGKVVGASSAGY